MHRLSRIWFALALLLLGAACSNHSQTQSPALKDRIEDDAGVLSAQDRRHISDLLEGYERETTHQIAVLIVSSLAGENIETFSRRIAKGAKLGRKDIDNGILIVLAPNEKEVRIELGLGFERYISDERAQEIITVRMLPFFHRHQYFQGLESGLSLLMSDGRAFVVHS